MGKKIRKRKKNKGNWLLAMIIAGIVGGFLFAVEYWAFFVWSVEGVVALAVLYLLYRIGMWIRGRKTKKQQGEIVRDSRYISPSLRQAVYTRDEGRCVQCQSQSLLEYDHILPLSKGGATSYENLQILCRACNRHKSDHI